MSHKNVKHKVRRSVDQCGFDCRPGTSRSRHQKFGGRNNNTAGFIVRTKVPRPAVRLFLDHESWSIQLLVDPYFNFISHKSEAKFVEI